MRPIRLEVQGLTSYKEPVSIDFTEFDLFAITGPTGSGKSSLVDAITYALFGQMPRVGRSIKDLISQGVPKMHVVLEFSADGERYRVHRSSALKGAAPIQLERFDEAEGDWKGLADRATDVTREIERVLRLDYEAFIRSVLLPQGEFQEFLAGDRDQRRRVLDRLLRLGIYQQMHQRANAMSAQQRGEAERIRERLDKELVDATPDALAAAGGELQALEQEAAELAGNRAALDQASRAAEQLVAASARREQEQRAAGGKQRELDAARATLAAGEHAIAEFDARLAELRAKAQAAEYDADLHLKLAAALTDARERDNIQTRITALDADKNKIREDLVRIQAATTQAANLVADAHTSTKTAGDAFEELRKANATVVLRSALKPGDQCPVCGQAIGSLPSGGDDTDRVRKQLDHARADLESARTDERKAEKAAADVERDAAVLAERQTKLEQQLAEVSSDFDRRTTALKSALGNADVTSHEVAQRVAALEAAKQNQQTLAHRERDIAEQREAKAKALASAQAGVAGLDAQVAAHRRDASAAEKDAAAAATSIRTLAGERRWEDTLAALEAGRDVAAIIRRDLERAVDRETQVNQDIGACRTRIEQIQQNIALAEELREKERQHTEQARIARDLATILQANALPAYIRESAMQSLASGASSWLRRVSGDRYDLKVHGQDFAVADLKNAGEERPVQTLSGGETFLASLALALALAEQLPGMSSEGDGSTLESLFIDEGFSHLDEETLNVVRSALEVLGADRRRLIGVITHVQALAEALPARIVVHKDSTGGPSRVTIE